MPCLEQNIEPKSCASKLANQCRTTSTESIYNTRDCHCCDSENSQDYATSAIRTTAYVTKTASAPSSSTSTPATCAHSDTQPCDFPFKHSKHSDSTTIEEPRHEQHASEAY
mmetsp:Transcript_17691/g.35693  ORF Transcript_17691/g.35693 Transcript_17691/m.35693 type:complete len:111 (-) Transcript_17691:868-1200(-)